MGKKKVAGLINNVQAVINEYTKGSDDFVTETNEILKELIVTAANDVMAAAPNIYCNIALIDGASEPAPRLEPRQDGMYRIMFSTPDDMIRPVSIVSTMLIRPIYEFLPITDARYAQQNSSIKGIGAGQYRPIAFISEQGIEGHAVARPTNSNSLYYVCCAKIENEENGDEVIELKDAIVNAVVYRTAQLVLESENSQAAQIVAQNYEKAMAAMVQ